MLRAKSAGLLIYAVAQLIEEKKSETSNQITNKLPLNYQIVK